jgi:hypothetical protein
MQWAGDPSMSVNKSAPQPTGDAPFTWLTFRIAQATCQRVGHVKAGLACSSYRDWDWHELQKIGQMCNI